MATVMETGDADKSRHTFSVLWGEQWPGSFPCPTKGLLHSELIREHGWSCCEASKVLSKGDRRLRTALKAE